MLHVQLYIYIHEGWWVVRASGEMYTNSSVIYLYYILYVLKFVRVCVCVWHQQWSILSCMHVCMSTYYAREHKQHALFLYGETLKFFKSWFAFLEWFDICTHHASWRHTNILIYIYVIVFGILQFIRIDMWWGGTWGVRLWWNLKVYIRYDTMMMWD